MSSGNPKTTRSSSWLRLRRKTRRSSEPKNLRYAATAGGGCPSSARRAAVRPAGASVTSALNVESFPGPPHAEPVQARGLHHQRADADARVHELGGAPLRLGVAELGGYHPVGGSR